MLASYLWGRLIKNDLLLSVFIFDFAWKVLALDEIDVAAEETDGANQEALGAEDVAPKLKESRISPEGGKKPSEKSKVIWSLTGEPAMGRILTVWGRSQ